MAGFIGFRRRKADGAAAHPLLADADGLRILAARSPSVLVLTDTNGDIVYRNDAATAMAKRTLVENGEAALVKLRAVLKDACLTSTSYPASRQFHVGEGDDTVYATLTVDPVPGGYVGTWRDVTSEVTFANLNRELSEALAAASTELTGLGEQLTGAAGEAAVQADMMSRGSQEMAVSIGEISERVHTAAVRTETAVNSAQSASGSVNKLQVASDQIGSVTSLIVAIAGKTKLLALNASIEAARAGDLGRGFAIVAGEVKDLAAKTAEATEQITAMIKQVQDESLLAAGAIADIVGQIQQVSEEQLMITNAVGQQSTTTAEMSQGIESVAATVRNSADTADHVHAAAAAIKGQVARLREALQGPAERGV